MQSYKAASPRATLAWANPIASTPDPVKQAFLSLKAEKEKRDAEMRERENTTRLTVKWATPIATISDAAPGAGRFTKKKLDVPVTDECVPLNDVAHAGRRVAWKDPIATVTEPESARWLKELMQEHRSRADLTKTVIKGKFATRPLSQGPRPSPGLLFTGSDRRAMSTKAVRVGGLDVPADKNVPKPDDDKVHPELSSPPRLEERVDPELSYRQTQTAFLRTAFNLPVGGESDATLVKPVVSARPVDFDLEAQRGMVDVETEGRMARWIRTLKSKTSWLWDLNREPITEEKQCLLWEENRRKRMMKMKSSEPAPWYVVALAIGWGVVVTGFFAWAFLL